VSRRAMRSLIATTDPPPGLVKHPAPNLEPGAPHAPSRRLRPYDSPTQAEAAWVLGWRWARLD
jgi:hypothetical protein